MNWERIRGLFTPAVILGAIGMCTLSFVASVAWLIWFAPPAALVTEAPGTGLNLIPGPSSTPPAPTATLPPTSTPTATFTPLLPGEIGLGSVVQIVGTDGFGLNIRNQAGLNSDVNFLGLDAEVFEILDGPVEADGFTWWYLVTPVDENRSGWAAANFLSLVANP